MKKYFLFVGMAVVCMLLTGCNDDPKKPISDLAKAMKSNDYQKAAACVENGNAKEIAEKIAKEPELQKVLVSLKPLSANINGNEAKVRTQMTVEVEVDVKKINGTWQIAELGIKGQNL